MPRTASVRPGLKPISPVVDFVVEFREGIVEVIPEVRRGRLDDVVSSIEDADDLRGAVLWDVERQSFRPNGARGLRALRDHVTLRGFQWRART